MPAFWLIVIKRDDQVVEEGEHLLAVDPEPLEEIALRGLLDLTTASRPGALRGQVGGEPVKWKSQIPGLEKELSGLKQHIRDLTSRLQRG